MVDVAFLIPFLSFERAFEILKPLVMFSVGMVIYSIFVFKFYRFIARKDVFDFNLNQYNQLSYPFFRKTLKAILYFIEHILLFPLFSVFWFGIISMLLAFLTKGQAAAHILLISMTLVVAVRITAYYKEDLSNDLAKLIPFGLLSVFLFDISVISFLNGFKTMAQILSLYEIIIYYLAFTIILEFILRIFTSFIHFFVKTRAANKERDYLF